MFGAVKTPRRGYQARPFLLVLVRHYSLVLRFIRINSNLFQYNKDVILNIYLADVQVFPDMDILGNRSIGNKGYKKFTIFVSANSILKDHTVHSRFPVL